MNATYRMKNVPRGILAEVNRVISAEVRIAA
jgi:hypothetical protein